MKKKDPNQHNEKAAAPPAADRRPSAPQTVSPPHLSAEAASHRKALFPKEPLPQKKQDFTIEQEDPQPERPEFCPNPHCPNHDRKTAAESKWYYPDGTHSTKSRGLIQRFRCKTCGKTCSTQTFSIHYWTHRDVDMQDLEYKLISCCGQRQIARSMQVTHRVVRNRTERIARNYLNLYDQALKDHTLSEDCAFDGLETYIRSQYFPTYLNILVGKKSQAVYGITANILRRKGRMTDIQKSRRSQIDAHWKPSRGSHINACTDLFFSLQPIIQRRLDRGSPWTIYTDKHKDYPRFLKKLTWLTEPFHSGKVIHKTISSRRARTLQNSLFPVNYLDRILRTNNADHVRETIRQGREINTTILRALITCAHTTFRKPHRTTDNATTENQPKHADIAGLTTPSDSSAVSEKRGSPTPTCPADGPSGSSPLPSRQRPALLPEGYKPGVKWALSRLYTRRHVWSHQETRMTWMRQIWKAEYLNPPVVDFETGDKLTGFRFIEDKEVKVKEPGNGWRARHLTV